MGAYQRRKGSRGQLEARRLLEGRDWQVSENCAGVSCADFIARDPSGSTFAVECKNTRTLAFDPFRRQAKEQAKKARARFLLVCRIPNHPGTFYVEGDGVCPAIWRSGS